MSLVLSAICQTTIWQALVKILMLVVTHVQNNYSTTQRQHWVYDKRNCTKVFKLKMGSYIYVKIIFNDFEIICWEILVLFTNKVH